LPAGRYGESDQSEVGSVGEQSPGPRAKAASEPLALCIGAGLALAFAPVIEWRLKTGDWVCLNDWFSLYYLRFAAQAYHHHLLYIGDIVVPGRVTTYPWLQFVPATLAARPLAAGPFAVSLIWIFLSAIGLSAALYFVFRHFLERPWAAAGCTMFCLSDYGFAAARPLTTQLQILATALWRHPEGLIEIPWGLLLQWRVPDPGLNLPFMFVQIVTLARAREHPSRLNLGLSGIAFGLLFYVFFYCWTMALVGLSIAFLLDRGARRIYVITLCLGTAVGLPQLLYGIQLDRLLSSEAIDRFGLFVSAPRFVGVTVPALSLLAVVAAGWWIWKSGRFDLVYVWSLVAGGMLLSRSRAMNGIFFHEYHYDWLWAPIRMVLLLIVAVSIVSTRFRLRPAAVSICWAALMLYFAGGVYLASICVTRTWSGVDQLRNYTRYKAQRLDPAVTPLVARATVAGDDAFCELAAVAEDQWVLSGEAVPRSFAVDNEQWESRAALNAYLVGIDRAKFEKAARVAADLWFWENPKREGDVTAAFMRKYDEVVQAPDRFIAEFGVRYVALEAEGPQMADRHIDHLRAGWTMLQRGPYWQIWERENSGS
jgi:hypothetical protein